MLLFSFSVFSDRRSLKFENENNSTKTLNAEAKVPRDQFINIETGWLELPLTGTNFQGSEPVRATKNLL